MRVIVTGSSGFIGTSLVERLAADGHHVIALDRADPRRRLSSVSYFSTDLLNRDALLATFADSGADGLIHLAARTDLGGRNLDAYAANTVGVRNVITAVKATATLRRAVFTSSQLVCRIGYVPQSDTDYLPDTVYGQSKVISEQIVRSENGGGSDWCIVRPTTVWGPGMGKHYQRFFKLVARGRYVHVGRRPLFKSYGFVSNVVHQYARLLEADSSRMSGRTFYLADYEPLSLRAWITAFQRALGAPPVRTIPEFVARAAARAGDLLNACGWNSFPYTSFRLRNVLTEYVVDMAATRDVCGPLPFDFSAGIAATVAWLRADGIVGRSHS